MIILIKNSTEEMVDLALKEMLKNNPEVFGCTCEVCIDDIRARTLNHLRPLYYSTLTGHAFTSVHHAKTQSQAEIYLQLNTSILKIKNNPSHK